MGDMGLPEPHSWKPTKEELMVISAQIHRLAEQELPFQRLTIDTDTALAMIGDTSFVGRRCTIPVAHQILHNDLPLYRYQGIALPKEVHLNHFAFSVLENRAARLNMAGLQTTKTARPV